jgi:hypothetical protein
VLEVEAATGKKLFSIKVVGMIFEITFENKEYVCGFDF